MDRLSGRRALVTGGSRGIGAAVVRRLAAEGAAVAVNYRSEADAAQALVDEIGSTGGRAVALQADVADPEAVRGLVDAAAEALGGLDVLVSNAGVEHFAPLDEITPADLDRVFGVNVGGQLFAAQAAARHLGAGSAIVLTSSVSATRSVFHHTLYGASKAAVNAMVLNLSAELGRRGIRINAVAPGGTATDMAADAAPHYRHPESDSSTETFARTHGALQRFAEPAEIAAAVAFLVSDDASYLTGRVLPVDGGFF